MPETLSRRSHLILIVSLVLLLIISLLARLYQLDSGIWLDEMTTYLTYARLPYAQIATTFESENQHFLYSILAHASFSIFGESTWALRLPAVLFGVGSILGLYLFGRLVTQPLEALLACGLMAFSYHHLWFSQNARGYTGMLFWTLLSSWLLILALQKGKWIYWLGFAASAALGVYTHLTMIFVLAGQGMVFLLRLISRKNRSSSSFWRGFTGFGISGLLIAILYAPVFNQMRQVIGGTQESVVTEWKSPIWTVLELIRGMQVGFSTSLLAALALGIFAIGLWSYWRSFPEVVGLLLIPPVLGAAITIAIGHHLWPRFFFFAIGFGSLVVMRGVSVLARWLSKRLRLTTVQASWLGLGLSLCLILVSAISMPFAYGPKQDFRSAMAFIETQAEPGDDVATAGIASYAYHDFYPTKWIEVESASDLQSIMAENKRTWLVITFPEVLRAVQPEIWQLAQTDYSLINEFPGSVNAGTIYVWRYDRP